MNKNKKTLGDKIAEVLNTRPTSFDPEDDNVDDTRAKLPENVSEEHEDEVEVLSTFRKQNAELLEDVDQRYAGKKASRRTLDDSDEFSEDEDQSEQESHSSEESENFEDGNIEDQTDVSSDELTEADEDEESEEYDESITPDKNLYDDEMKNGNFKHFNDTDGSSQIDKGLCVRNQLTLWENILELRIQLQKCLVLANKLPQRDDYVAMIREGGRKTSVEVAKAKDAMTSLLDKFLLLQKLGLNRYPETKKLGKSSGSVTKEINDEEIPSDTESELSSEDEEEEIEPPKKRRKLSDFENEINEIHNLYKTYRNSVIQKWNDKTKIASLKNNSNSHSVLDHIEHTLSDKSKLIKRTQLKRSDYSILGQQPSTSAENELNEENINECDTEGDNKPVEEYNSEIFDDDDFYHQLLRELIEVKSADLTDPIQLGRQWIQLQKLRSKMKRKIDTRATKGRKIRYTVHTKLVNFMAPFDEQQWTDQSKTELFNSLFGKKEYAGT